MMRDVPHRPANLLFCITVFLWVIGWNNISYAQFNSTFELNTHQSGLRFSDALDTASQDTVPLPRNVMMQSVILPGWGQYTNRQIWKIPIVYGLMGGLSYYAYWAHTQYSGYRAAFYNSNPENDDLRFGQTPSWIDPNAPADFYRNSRDFFRNRRDFLIVTVVLSYVLNIVDAYVYAHMRDFDVSDDLSSRIQITPSSDLAAGPNIGLTFKLRF